MRIVALKTLRAHWQRHGREDSEQPLRAWYTLVAEADWTSPGDVKADIRTASVIPGNRVVFNIGGNKYRLIVKFNYAYRIGYIRFVGTHAEYDSIDAPTV